MVEHVGDVYANGAVVGRDFTKDPGLHRTMAGDGLATMVAGFIGGPANTTYSENTAVLAATGNYNPVTLRIAAVIAIVVSFCGKAIGIVETVPNCVLGGACIVLYGMIACGGPAHAGGKPRGLHQEPQPVHRRRDAGAGHGRRHHRRS